jgi:hypothetical protein
MERSHSRDKNPGALALARVWDRFVFNNLIGVS